MEYDEEYYSDEYYENYSKRYEVGKWIDATKYNLNDRDETRFCRYIPNGTENNYEWMMIAFTFEGEDEIHYQETILNEDRTLDNFGYLLDEIKNGCFAIYQRYWDDVEDKPLAKPTEHRMRIWGFMLIPEFDIDIEDVDKETDND